MTTEQNTANPEEESRPLKPTKSMVAAVILDLPTGFIYFEWVANEYLTRKADRVMATAQDAGVVIRTVYRVLERRVS